MISWTDIVDWLSLHPQYFLKHPLVVSPPSSLQKISQISPRSDKQKQANTETYDLNIHNALTNSEQDFITVVNLLYQIHYKISDIFLIQKDSACRNKHSTGQPEGHTRNPGVELTASTSITPGLRYSPASLCVKRAKYSHNIILNDIMIFQSFKGLSKPTFFYDTERKTYWTLIL